MSGAAHAEDGYELWLRYKPLPAAEQSAMAAHASAIVAPGSSDTVRVAVDELRRGFGGMTGHAPERATGAGAGAILLATPDESPDVAALKLPLGALGKEGFLIRSIAIGGQPVTLVTANSDIGLLYGAFRLLELAEAGQPLDKLDIQSAPKLQLRVLDHWDNLDRTVERGYAGQSIWDWWKLPDWKAPRYTDYARANASIGINGAVLNNVNAQPASLTAPFIAKAAALADVFRPYGIKVYLSPRFSAPIEIGGLKTADPLDPEVKAWWKAKADEIYRAIPDFGGFLVKANSEGQPGPQDYHRTHADGANVLADAVKPHGGIVMYRAFVYSENNAEDRAKQAYSDFKPIDGKFADNVIVQVKNGAIDFQPREPFHPLFGAMPKTPLMMEFQITKEYLGFATHLVYLGPLFQETLESDTYAHGKGSTVAHVLEGKVDPYRLTGMAGVANIGSDRNWSGSVFNQANWYAFGRFAWDPDASAEKIAAEWARMTFTPDPAFVAPAVKMMMGSREAAVDYMTPLGLAHQMGTSHHYGPAPWVSDLARPEWNPTYYSRADASGIGFDRTATGSNAMAQYAPPVARMFANPKTTPETLLLWFHHMPWDTRMASGRTLWADLIAHYDAGVADVGTMRAEWAKLRPYVDADRFAETSVFLSIQQREAQWWRDASIAYFQSVSKRPLPAGVTPPAQTLEYYESLRFPIRPGN
ncbi:alpha-glucuronidase family glycosyl hydrolase [Sphingomonas sp. PR090111-T3T-6A]|uniref:alpha-glucuronidase family glycosyl hydrolase n=1 Tax=Sphingomonas sp. PR090111-T3T-6A TaxID=685778 RepID=UPI0006851D43|nr:alpha-glucuronidase family glycosyl hydrolase [Sphingomonas sp. PR090111-T3T-6A]